MYLKDFSILNFKSFEQQDLEFCSRINCFIGNNGVGKTNLLDAIYYLSFCKSYFTNIDSHSIKHGEKFLMVQGNYERKEKKESILCSIKKGQKKQFKRNKKDYTKLSDHIGLLPLVMVSPSDIRLILEGSEERRKFINGVISQYDKGYLEDLISYRKALMQRNTLLKDFAKSNRFDSESLDIWTQQLIMLGQKIYTKRTQYIEEFIPIFQKYYEFISQGKERVDLIYESQLHKGDVDSLMQQSLEKDRILQYTTVGIHKDDLSLNLGEFPIKRTGSQGQKKTYLIALKLAQFDFIRKLTGLNPILLLDDIFDKLDRLRVKQILELVADTGFGQIFITDTSAERLQPILKEINTEYKIFQIHDGKVEITE